MSSDFQPFSLTETLRVNKMLTERLALERALLPHQSATEIQRYLNNLVEAQKLTIQNASLHEHESYKAIIDAVKACENANLYASRGNIDQINKLTENTPRFLQQIKDWLEVSQLRNRWKPNAALENVHNQLSVENLKTIDQVKFSLDEMKTAAELARKNLISGD